jgi:spore maturation protein SpmB
MTDTSATTPGKPGIWLRGLLMLLMVIAFQISGTLLAVGAIIQFVLALLGGTPNARLTDFGQRLGLYLDQIASFVTFATEEAPFPFGAWPSGR